MVYFLFQKLTKRQLKNYYKKKKIQNSFNRINGRGITTETSEVKTAKEAEPKTHKPLFWHQKFFLDLKRHN